MFMFLFLFFSMLLPCSFFRLKELSQVKNGVTTSLVFFFFLNAKNLARSDDGKQKKKEDDQMYRDQSGEFLCQWSEVL